MQGQYRTTFDVHLTQSGTYKIANVMNGFMASYTLNGEQMRWRGAASPGGAFQAGALLASGIVLLRLAGALPVLRWSQWPLRLLVLVGLLLFVAVAVKASSPGPVFFKQTRIGRARLFVRGALRVRLRLLLGFFI